MAYQLPQPLAGRCGHARRRAFTLVELMISIAMVLVLLIGINQVFKMSADTVGSGMITSAGMRDLRATRNTLTNDLTQMTTPSGAPFIIIHNQIIPAYLNKQDQAANPTLAPTPNELLVPDVHAHRMDILEFFVSGGDFRRQSGTMNATAFQGDLSSADAFVHIGHLRLPDNPPLTNSDVTKTATYLMPEAGTAATNPNNFYASQWILGRERLLMVEKNSNGVVQDSSNVNQWFSDFTAVTGNTIPTLQPLAWNSKVIMNPGVQQTVGSGPSNQVFVQSSFTDVAGMALGAFDAVTTKAFAASPANAARQMIYNTGSPTLPGGVYRFAGKPWLDKSTQYAGSAAVILGAGNSLLPLETALEAPLFLRGCSQFIVEYAGDYMQQKPDTGDWTADGASPTLPELDWNPVYGASGKVVGRTVRWYGMQRAANIPAGATAANITADVMPLYWYLATANHTIASANRGVGASPGSISKTPNPTITKFATFERLDVLGTGTPAANNYAYDCAWGPADLAPPIPPSGTAQVVTKAPWMIRITIRVDDPSGRLPDGQTMEFIYELPHPK